MQQFYSLKSFYIFFFLLFSVGTNAEIVLVSWNIKDFGQSRTDEEIIAIARHIKHADIIAIQEVVAIHPGGAQAVARLANQLNRMGSNWDYSISDPTQSTSSHRSERYAFLWKTSKFSVTGGGPKLISELSQSVEREPFMIQFRANSKVLTVLNYHACTHNADFPERNEILAISRWLTANNYANIIWAGDMNLEIDDVAFRPILNHGFKNVLNGEKTSLRMRCRDGDYLSSAEDNVLHKIIDFNFKSARVLDFIAGRDCNLVTVLRDSYSDHLAVELVIN